MIRIAVAIGLYAIVGCMTAAIWRAGVGNPIRWWQPVAMALGWPVFWAVSDMDGLRAGFRDGMRKNRERDDAR